MAIVRSDSIVPVDEFVSGLEGVAGSIVRIVADTPSQDHMAQGTGWFITANLVVAAGFAVAPSQPHDFRNFRVQAFKGKELKWEAGVLGAPEPLGRGLLPQARAEVAVALLRVDEWRPEYVLPFRFDLQAAGDLVTIVHFPEGKPRVGVSFGRVSSADDLFVSYDANTLPGASGAPVFDQQWRVVAMHVLTEFQQKLNKGLTRSTLLQTLRTSPLWSEIARQHRIADDVAAQQKLQAGTAEAAPPPAVDPILIQAALSPSLAPQSLSEDEKSRLRAHVADAGAERWALRPADRRNIITSVGSIEGLRAHRPQDAPRDAAQGVIDDILDGPPYHLSDASEESLAWWMQASRWFEGVAPELPSAGEVARQLERRRLRGRLDRIAGAEFRGRKTELDRLRRWYKKLKGPFLLTGVGGIGKSALIAQFASELPADTLLLWLDFDRADLAPDDAVSVLAAIAEQASVQLETFEKQRLEKAKWKRQAIVLGQRLSVAVSPKRPPLLVLDSFEAAQYTERYQELWPVLERVSKSLPSLRLAVTGRAPIPNLRLGGRRPDGMHLKGLNVIDARQWLREKGIKNAKVLARVIELSDGIPLILRLALRFVETGGRVQDLPRDLPQAIVAGYLYDRILDRVQTADLKEVAKGALVLRRLTIDMITPVLDGLVTFPTRAQSEWFAELSREMALVEGSDVLQLRPEVRTATLELLERDQPALVRAVDESAVKWYTQEAGDDPELAAELVYHRLRLGDVPGAEQAWREGCGAFLTYADEEIRDARARAWLQARLGAGGKAGRPVGAWEQEATERIKSARSRHLHRAVGQILRERTDRSSASPLVFQEAFELRSSGKHAAAQKILDEAGAGAGAIGRDRTALRALLAADAGDRQAADALLARLDDASLWSDRPSFQIEALAVQAARVRLTVDIQREIKLLNTITDRPGWTPVRRALSPVDVVLPRLRQRLNWARPALELSTDHLDVESEMDRKRLLDRVEAERVGTIPKEPEATGRLRGDLIKDWSGGAAWKPSGLRPADFGLSRGRHAAVPILAELGWRRWWLLANGPFLRMASELCRQRTQSSSPLAVASLGTLAIFALRLGSLRLGISTTSIGDELQENPIAYEAVRVSSKDWKRIVTTLEAGVDPQHDWSDYARVLDDGSVEIWLDQLLSYRGRQVGRYPGNPGPFLLSLVAPDPLQELVADLAGDSGPSRVALHSRWE